MKPVNLKTLAQALNLSVATISRALSDRHEISQGTKDRVRQLADELNYIPNPHASSLRRSKSRTIGVVIPEVDNPFFALAINGIEEVARKNDYHVLIYLTHDSYEREDAIVRLLASGRVDGVLLSVASTSREFAHLELLLDRAIPLVFFDRIYMGFDTASVTSDDYASGYQATRHLLEQGCRTIAHLALAARLSISAGRLRGYQAALEEAGIPFDDGLLLHSPAEGAPDAAVQDLLARRPDIDGVFAAVESLAISTYRACQRLRRCIPEDVKVIGFSNSPVAELLHPPLSTITQPAYGIGQEAAAIVFQAINRNRPALPAQSRELKSTLMVRASTAPVASAGPVLLRAEPAGAEAPGKAPLRALPVLVGGRAPVRQRRAM